MANRLALVVFSLLGLVAIATATAGTATYYTPPYTPSACYGYTDEGTLIAAASSSIYNNGAACGSMYKITCTGRTNDGDLNPCTGQSVTVKIVDLCPSGCQGTFDLSQEAFSVIANTDAGKVYIDYTLV